MKTTHHTAVLTCLASLAILGSAGSDALAQPAGAKPSKACGSIALPLTVGNTWTYEPVAPPTPIPEQNARLHPRQPKKLIVQVTSVETQNGLTTVKLTEDADGRKIDTTITCAADRFDVSPDSIFFAGEPGGTWNLEITDLQRTGTSWMLKAGKLTGPEWTEKLIMQWKRVPTAKVAANLGSGKLELSRRVVVQPAEDVATTAGQFHATLVELELSGQVTLAAATDKPAELPVLIAKLWFADDVGLLQALNGYGQMYSLTAVTVAK